MDPYESSEESSEKKRDQPAKKTADAAKRKTAASGKPANAGRPQSPSPMRSKRMLGEQAQNSDRPESVLNAAETDFGPSEIDTTAMPNTAMSENSEERHRRIAAAAYTRAERRGFAPGKEDEDWLSAEAELYGGYTEDRAENDRNEQSESRAQ